MGKRFDYEYIIIGGGLAGITAARQLAEAGRKVAIAEKDRLGGSGLSTTRAVAIQKDLESLGITIIKGEAHFTGTYDVAIGDQSYSANKFLITTGTELNPGNLKGLDVPYLTPATAYANTTTLKMVVIIGGGATGCELAETYAKRGTKVVLIEKANRILPEEDEDISKVMEQYLIKRYHVKLFTKTKALSLEKDKIASRLVLLQNDQEKTVRVNHIILATGRQPAINIGLKNIGVSYDKKGIVANRALQTSARHVYAAGDVIDNHGSSERAIYTGEVAVVNMLDHTKTFVNYDGFMRCIDTDPPVAVVGQTEKELTKRRRKYRKILVPLSAVSASIVHHEKIGFIKIMIDHQGKILGAAMIGPTAPTVLQEIALSIRHNLPLIQIASTPHKEDDWGNIVKVAARKLLAKKN